MAATVAKGAFRFVSGRPGNAGTKTIATPGASIGIRGTLLEGVVGSDAAGVLAGEPGLPALPANGEGLTLVVLVGPGATSETFDKPGIVDVTSPGHPALTLNRPGQAVIAIAGQAPFGPFTLSDAALARLAALLANSTSGGSLPNGIGSVTLAAGVPLTLADEAINLTFEIPGPGTNGQGGGDKISVGPGRPAP